MSKRYDAKGGQVMGVPITVRLRGADLAFCAAYVRLWPKAAISSCNAHVRFRG